MSSDSLVDIKRYPFSGKSLNDLRSNAFAVGGWPLVYVLSDEKKLHAAIARSFSGLR